MTATLGAALLVLGWLPMLIGIARSRSRPRVPHTQASVDRALLGATWLACAALTVVAAFDVLRGNATSRVASGVAVFLGAMMLWSWARAAQGVHFAQIARAPDALVTSGPYRYLRHPLYMATAAGTAGHVVAAGTWRAATLWVVLLVVLAVRSVREERLLRAAFGATWDAYARRSLGWLRPSRVSTPK